MNPLSFAPFYHHNYRIMKLEPDGLTKKKKKKKPLVEAISTGEKLKSLYTLCSFPPSPKKKKKKNGKAD